MVRQNTRKGKEEHPFIKRLRRAVLCVTIVLILLFFYEAYFG